MKVVSYNIQYGRGQDGIIDLVRSCNAIRGADIICLQEVDQHWQRSGDLDQAAEISGLLPSYYTVYGSSFDVDASARAAHGAVTNRRRRHGNMILSHWPILSTRVFNLPKQNYADKFNMHMTFIEAVIDAGTARLRVYNYHGGYLEAAERLEQVEYFAKVFARSPIEGGAWSGESNIGGDDWSNRRQAPTLPSTAIFCGDFNARPDTEEYRLLIESTGLVDCWAQADPANRLTSTGNRESAEGIEDYGKIDHIMVTPDLCERVEQVAIDHAADGSDHKPVSAVLKLA